MLLIEKEQDIKAKLVPVTILLWEPYYLNVF